VSITYGNGLFVAVANGGTNRVMTSPDGITWTSRTAAAANDWYGVTYGDGLFVAVSYTGTSRVMTSSDGITWTSKSSADDTLQWYGVAYGNGRFVAVSWSGANRVMTSGKPIENVPPYDHTYQGGMTISGDSEIRDSLVVGGSGSSDPVNYTYLTLARWAGDYGGTGLIFQGPGNGAGGYYNDWNMDNFWGKLRIAAGSSMIQLADWSGYVNIIYGSNTSEFSVLHSRGKPSAGMFWGTVSDTGKYIFSGTGGMELQGPLKNDNLAGTYTGGSANVCVYDSGVIYASDTGCP